MTRSNIVVNGTYARLMVGKTFLAYSLFQYDFAYLPLSEGPDCFDQENFA